MLQKNKGIWQWLSLIAGIFVTALPVHLFFLPHNIAPGGVTGISTLINALTGLPVGVTSAVLNLPLFMVGWKSMGRSFTIKSLVGMLGVSAVIDLVPLPSATDDPMLAAIFGGVMLGAGIGLVIRGGATTGGTDMAAALIHKRFPILTIGGILLTIDCLVILASGFVFSIQSAMYALICIFLSTQVMDRLIEGLGSAKAFFVFSRQTEEIAAEVLTKIGRGATLLHAKGAYSGTDQKVLLCVITRLQIPQFKSVVKGIDPDAFMMVTDVREAMGEGFTRPQT